ncbi:hypothetical protein KDL67_01320 [bacterium]|nr:hypothetical protein [bacterium]
MAALLSAAVCVPIAGLAMPCSFGWVGFCPGELGGDCWEGDGSHWGHCYSEAAVIGDSIYFDIAAEFAYLEAPIRSLSFSVSGFPTANVETAIEWLHEPETPVDELDGFFEWTFDPPLEPVESPVILGRVRGEVLVALPGGQEVLIDGGFTDILGQRDVSGPGRFVFNPGQPYGECFYPYDFPPSWPWMRLLRVSPEEGATVAGEFPLTFTAHGYRCSDVYALNEDYSGEVRVNGASVHVYSGSGEDVHTVTLSTAGMTSGEIMTVEIRAENGASTAVTMHYVVDITTVDSASWSAVKSKY